MGVAVCGGGAWLVWHNLRDWVPQCVGQISCSVCRPPCTLRVIRLEQGAVAATSRLGVSPLAEDTIGTQDLGAFFDEDGGDVVEVCSSDGLVLYVSAACQSMTGWTPTGLVGRSADDFVHPDDLASVMAARRHARISPAAVVFTFRFRCADGSYLWSEASLRAASHPRNHNTSVIVACVRSIADRKLVEARLERQALTDPLTGIANRSLFMDRLDQALRRLDRTRSVLGLIYLDLDRFKVINDSLGHDLGDRLLVAIAQRAAAHLRPADTLARIGGDEFVIIVEDLADAAQAATLAQRTCSEFEQPFDLGGETIVCTTSAGVATTTASAHSATGLLHEADLALYRAKDRGRNRAEVFDEELRAATVGRLGTERMIRAALVESRVVAHYQPIIDLGTEQTVSAEALVRIEAHGRFAPAETFIRVAEETGLLVAIDDVVLASVVTQAASWTGDEVANGFRGVSFNVTSRRLADSSFVEVVAAALRDHDLPAGSLIVEVTERSLMEASNSTLASIRSLRSLGVPVGLDNFGTGFSSLAYLRQFPLDFVKIDQSFVRLLGPSRRDLDIVHAVIDLGHALGLTVVAEGVETEQQLDILTALGCDQAQGFGIAGPADPATVTTLIEGRCRPPALTALSVPTVAGMANGSRGSDAS